MTTEQNQDIHEADREKNSRKGPVCEGNLIRFSTEGEVEAYRLGYRNGEEYAAQHWRCKAYNWVLKAVCGGSVSLLCAFIWSKNEISNSMEENEKAQEMLKRQQRVLDKYRDYILDGKISSDTLELRVI